MVNNPKFPMMLSPMRVGNVVFRNRMLASASKPAYIQGPEKYPAEGIITHYANKAKNGAAAVTVTLAGVSLDGDEHDMFFDFNDKACQNYISQLTDSIHYYGSLASAFLLSGDNRDYDVSDGIATEPPPFYVPGRPAFSKAQILQMVEDYADQAARLQELGFDMAYIHSAYRGMPIARFLSPLTNKREDEFGGSLENRMRFLLMVCDRIKEKCGKDFLLEVCMSGHDPSPDGLTLEDTIEIIKRGVGHFDLVQLRASNIDPAHPTGYFKERIPYLYMAEAVKKSGVEMPVELIGGCFYPDECEAALREGKADFIVMARGWICNPEYGKLVYEGRDEDLTPCIRCNKCHRTAVKAPWVSACSVNPTWAIEHRLDRFVAPVERQKKVAVIGGGPAGMEAALIAKKRGHSVTLYEKSDELGGQLKAASMPSFKWPLRDFKSYLVRQIEKSSVNVILKAQATAETLRNENYDEIIAAIGAEAIIPNIPGANGKKVVTALDALTGCDGLAEDIVVIGGGEIGVDTGMHLAEKGHNVVLIEMRDKLAPDSAPHSYSMLMDYVNACKGFSYILNAICMEITDSGVAYKDADGSSRELKAGSVVMAVGTKAKIDEALALYSPGKKVALTGDCLKAANLQKAMRSAFATASQI